MREILFKAKRTDNGEWVEGYLIQLPYCGKIRSWISDISDKTRLRSAGHIFCDWRSCEVVAETVCQYTGLTDKNGRKIWENDIVEFDDTGEEGYEYKEGFDFQNRAVVIWHNGGFELSKFLSNNSEVLETMNDCREDFWNVFKDFRAIGNIFDNPDLLKGGDDT